MKVGVIGSGSIGPDLAYGFLSAIARKPGAEVFLVDIRQEALDAGVERIRGYVKKGLSRGKLSPKAAAAIDAALKPTMKLSDLVGCEYVLEAASEDLPIKRKILADLEAVVSSDCLIGFATSGIPRAQIAAEAKVPARCFVNHPFYPAWRSLPIEIVLSGDTALGERMIATMKKLGKVPVVTSDVECFAADDIFCNYISEAARMVEEGLATPAQIDRIVNDALGGGGPFNVMDATRGNLLVHKCQLLMQNAKTGTPWFAPPAILTKQGDDLWNSGSGDASHDAELATKVLDRIMAVVIARSYFIVDNAICEATELDWMTRMALGFKQSGLSLAASLGAERVYEICSSYAGAHEGFEVPASIREKNLGSSRSNVLVERDGDIGIVRVFRPEVLNALSKKTIAEIDSAFDELASDGAVRGIVFSSYGGSLAGADINELASLNTPDECRAICMATHPVMQKIEALPKPVVAAVDGPVLGGGAEFSMACHARVVGKRLMLGQPEVNLGIIPGYGGSQRLPRLIGVERANQLLRNARSVGAAEAVEWGWANELAANPEEAAKALIRQHLEGSVKLAAVDPAPLTVGTLEAVDIGHRSLVIDAILVDVLQRGLAAPLSEGLAIEADGFARCKETVDLDIGMKNFIQNGPRVPALFLHE
jgi:enoyl-CoA hydratase / 3-hydroxyacyl-CoA dehydrogenase